MQTLEVDQLLLTGLQKAMLIKRIFHRRSGNLKAIRLGSATASRGSAHGAYFHALSTLRCPTCITTDNQMAWGLPNARIWGR